MSHDSSSRLGPLHDVATVITLEQLERSSVAEAEEFLRRGQFTEAAAAYQRAARADHAIAEQAADFPRAYVTGWLTAEAEHRAAAAAALAGGRRSQFTA